MKAAESAVSEPAAKRRGRGGSKRSASAKAKATASPAAVDEVPSGEVSQVTPPAVAEKPAEPVGVESSLPADLAVEAPVVEARSEKKPASRSRRPRKPKAAPEAAG